MKKKKPKKKEPKTYSENEYHKVNNSLKSKQKEIKELKEKLRAKETDEERLQRESEEKSEKYTIAVEKAKEAERRELVNELRLLGADAQLSDDISYSILREKKFDEESFGYDLDGRTMKDIAEEIKDSGERKSLFTSKKAKRTEIPDEDLEGVESITSQSDGGNKKIKPDVWYKKSVEEQSRLRRDGYSPG